MHEVTREQRRYVAVELQKIEAASKLADYPALTDILGLLRRTTEQIERMAANG